MWLLDRLRSRALRLCDTWGWLADGISIDELDRLRMDHELHYQRRGRQSPEGDAVLWINVRRVQLHHEIPARARLTAALARVGLALRPTVRKELDLLRLRAGRTGDLAR